MSFHSLEIPIALGGLLQAQDYLACRIKPRDKALMGQAPARVAQEKIDGWRLTLIREAELIGQKTTARAFTRTTDVTDRIDRSWFRRLLVNMPPGSMMDCELTVPGRNASAVSSLLAGNDPNGKGGLTKPEGSHLTCFCIQFWDGKSRWRDTFAVQRTLALKYFRSCCGKGQSGLRFARWWRATVSERQPADRYDAAMGKMNRMVIRPMTELELADLLQDVRSRDSKGRRHHGTTGIQSRDEIEGFVLKETPFSGWVKFKPTKTVDLVCTGIEPGEGKYFGMCGAIKGSVVDFVHAGGHEMHEVASVSGMTDAVREQITEADKGRVFECEYQLIGDGGRLRHPRFLRWREDKQDWECGASQLSPPKEEQ